MFVVVFFLKFFLSSYNLTLARFVWINDEMLKLRWKYGWLLNILLQSDYIGWLIVLMKYKFSGCRHYALNIHCMCTVRKRSSGSMANRVRGASGKMRIDCASLSVKEHLINSFGVFTRCANISHRCNVIPFVSDTRPDLGSSTSNTNSKLFYGKTTMETNNGE